MKKEHKPVRYQPAPEYDYPTFDLAAYKNIHGLSWRKLAKLAGLDASYVYRLTQNDHILSFEAAQKMFKALREYDQKNPTNNFSGLPLI